jgi:hypothetical protein
LAIFGRPHVFFLLLYIFFGFLATIFFLNFFFFLLFIQGPKNREKHQSHLPKQNTTINVVISFQHHHNSFLTSSSKVVTVEVEVGREGKQEREIKCSSGSISLVKEWWTTPPMWKRKEYSGTPDLANHLCDHHWRMGRDTTNNCYHTLARGCHMPILPSII